ncbi:DUF1611 domain-containing protein [bacterium]|nr:DUF1611 domain-containing protein [bacterium]
MTEKPIETGSKTSTMMGTAIILTNGSLDQTDAKTAHGLIRRTERFDLLGVIDSKCAGKDAGEVLDGIHRNIPIFATVADFLLKTGITPDFALIGVALSGGRLNEQWQMLLLEVIGHGISIVNGLHMLLGDIPAFCEAASKNNVKIIDIRRPKPFDQLHHWCGSIFEMSIPRLAILGIDCAVGKRTTCQMILEACRKEGITCEMIYTGQTGWFQGNRHGFILDATLNDFVSGELEAAIVECEQLSSPDLILVEGQSAMRNPVGPCGAEIILSGNVKGVILQHAPFRATFDTTEKYGCMLPSLEDEIKLIEMYGTKVLAVTLNGNGGTSGDLMEYAKSKQEKIGLPVICPLEEGVSDLLPVIRRFMRDFDQYTSTTLLKPEPVKG